MKQLITIYSPLCVWSWVWGTYWLTKEDIWYLRFVIQRVFNISASQNVWWNLSDWILDFCAKTSGLITWLVYPITESLSLTHFIHRNYHFTNPAKFFLYKILRVRCMLDMNKWKVFIQNTLWASVTISKSIFNLGKYCLCNQFICIFYFIERIFLF